MNLIILDRDGVINFDSPNYIKSPEEWIPIPGSLEAIAALTRANYRIALITNQSGIGRGLYDLATLNAIHEKMQLALANLGGNIEAIFFCPHLPQENCPCRKPGIKLYADAQAYFNSDIRGIWAIGDSKRDLEAASTMSCLPVLVRTGNGAGLLASQETLPSSTIIFDDLLSATKHLLGNHH